MAALPEPKALASRKNRNLYFWNNNRWLIRYLALWTVSDPWLNVGPSSPALVRIRTHNLSTTVLQPLTAKQQKVEPSPRTCRALKIFFNTFVAGHDFSSGIEIPAETRFKIIGLCWKVRSDRKLKVPDFFWILFSGRTFKRKKNEEPLRNMEIVYSGLCLHCRMMSSRKYIFL